MSEEAKTVEVDKTLKRIWLGNLPTTTKRAELEDLCLSCGKVIKIDYRYFSFKTSIQYQSFREGGTFGFVTFQSHEDADFAIYKLNTRNFHGQALKARWSDKEVKKPEAQRSTGPRQERPKPKKEKKPMMSLTHLTPRNEPSRPGTVTTPSASGANFEWKANQNSQIVQQSGHSHQLDHTQNQSHNHQYNQNPPRQQNQHYNEHRQPNHNYQQNNSNYNSHNRNHFPNNTRNNQQQGGWVQ